MRLPIALLACLLAVAPATQSAAEEGGLIDSLQDIRKNYRNQFNFDLDRGHQVQDPAIAGTRIIVGAMSQLDPRARSRQIDSAVALLRNNPEVVEGVFQRAVGWIERNPQMAEAATDVLRTVAARLDGPPSRPAGRFALPGGF